MILVARPAVSVINLTACVQYVNSSDKENVIDSGSGAVWRLMLISSRLEGAIHIVSKTSG